MKYNDNQEQKNTMENASKQKNHISPCEIHR